MANKPSRIAMQHAQVRQNIADLWIETLRELAPRSTERLLNSGIELLEAHREFLAGRIAHLENAKQQVSKKSSRKPAARKVLVRSAKRRNA
jgi:hypothetical protein